MVTFWESKIVIFIPLESLISNQFSIMRPCL